MKSKLWVRAFFLVSLFSLFSCENPFIIQIVEPKTIVFDSGGGSHVESQTVYKGYPVKRPSNPYKSGYTFDDWYSSAAFQEKWDFNTVPKNDMTLYANWNVIDGVAVSGVTLNKTTLTLTVGGAETLTATVLPEDATHKVVTWTTSDDAIAAVNQNGAVTAVAAGTATITVTTEDGGFTAVCAVTVTSGGSITSPTGIELVYIPAGTFTMGSPDSEPDRNNNETQHTVTLTAGFYMGKYEVTQEQYKTVMGSNPSSFTTAVAGESGTPGKLPVDQVSWYDALVFCNKLSMAEGLIPAYSISGSTNPSDWGSVPIVNNNSTWNAAQIVSGSNGYRLPTEAQWEYVAKGGNPDAAGWVGYSYSGSDTAGNVAWYKSNSELMTHEVGKKAANALGLYDMSGNVYEWCWDWYESYQSGAQTDPQGAASGSDRVIRGGSWYYENKSARSAYRFNYAPSSRDSDWGFRLVRPDISAAPAPTYGITLDKTGTQTFTAATFGYGAQTPLSVTVTNTGNQATGALTAALSGTNAGSFMLTGASISSIAVSGTGTFTVRPNTGLAAGTYTATVTVSGTNVTAQTFNVSFTVNAASGSITSPQGIELVYVPAGTFTMGSPTTESGRDTYETQHTVTLTKSFYMGKYQVTQDQYRAVMGTGTGVGTGNPSSFTTAVAGESETPGKLPVERVSWYDALVFCNKLSVMEGLSPAYSIYGSTDPTEWGAVPTSSNTIWDTVTIVADSNGYRLPTEAQWEYACRAGTTTAFNDGNAVSSVMVGWYIINSGNKTHQVGLKTANAWGLYDMHGNVYEWCWDWYNLSYYSSSPTNDPAGASSGTRRVERGGDWGMDGQGVRSAHRNSYSPSSRAYSLGFRLVRPDISAAPIYGISLSQSGTYPFPAAAVGYGTQTPLSVTVTNTGNQATGALTAALSGTNASSFTLSTTSITSIATNETGTFTVRPNTGLAAGTYTATVTVSGGNGITASFNVSFTVNAASGPITSPQGIELVYVSAGTFTIGSPEDEAGRYNWETQHSVTLTKSFYMGKYEVTQEQYQAVMGSNPSSSTAVVAGEIGTPGKLPVERVSWYDALVFCNTLSMMEGLSPAYSISDSTDPAVWGTVPTNNNFAGLWKAVTIVSGSSGYRLPTEAQWEYACRAGTTTAFNTGAAISDNTGWYNSNSGSKTHQVGLKTANAWGLYDTHGNVSEWCWDLYEDYYMDGAQTDPEGASSGSNRAIRNGSYNGGAMYLRSAYRNYASPSERLFYVGFRLVRP